MKHITKLIGTFALLGATVVASPALADTKTFKAGSLIIPASSVYQTDCGAVAMYGLIYDVLRANPWLDADPGYGPIEIYYTFNPDKVSPNRCTPTNKHTPPTVSTTWTDGCDFSLSDSSGTKDIVKLAANNTAAVDNKKITTFNTSAKTNVYPTYNTTQDITAANGVTTVRYSGGSFVIDESDADTFMKLIRGQIAAKDNGVLINFSLFRPVTGSTPTACNYHSDWKNSAASVGGWVNIHRSFVDFTAPIPKRFDSAPPRLALLALDSAADGTGTVSNDILQGYLSRAGLKFTGANGCPAGSVHKTETGANNTCPNGDVNGEIYDTFDFKDILDNRLDNTVYKMFWAPHWEFKSTAGPNSDEKAVVAKISAFLESKTGLMGECASINNFEGSTIAVTDTQGKFQTCQNNGSGACSATFNSRGLSVNSGGTYTSNPANATLRNCSDVNLASGACYYISYPGDSYAQFGDYAWVSDDGVVSDFLPNAGQLYKPGVLPLVSGVASVNAALKTATPAAARASGLLKGDYVARSIKDNLDTKGNILYLGGHDLTASVAGTKVVLQTLLQLGTTDPLTRTVEVSRAMPIPTTIGLVQGTYESVQPTAGTPKKMLLDTDAASFEFPFTKGHLRAYTTVSAAAATFETLAAAASWDVSGSVSSVPNIPVANYSGCTPYSLACRTVFTNTVTNCSPTTTPCTSTVFSDTTAPTLGVLMANDLSAASKVTLVRRTLEGVPAPSLPNLYKATLGGIDRSTTAVIPASSLAGVGSRPMMIYVGGTDGMMHAICGDNVSPCTAGRELWAFMPRNQLSSVRTNTTRIDGSPRVQDLYGDFDGSGNKTFRTVLVFQTGSGDPAAPATAPAVYALDVTDPDSPTILWEHTTPGRGLAITMGKLSNNKIAAFAQTNTGTTSAGSVVTAIDVETGLTLWTNTLAYPAPRTVSRLVPATGIPGGAVGIDLVGGGNLTDVVFATLYGQIYRLNATTGVNPYDPSPLFQFTTDLKPFGAAPAVFGDGALYAVSASGGYVDYNTDVNPLWTSSSTMQQAVAVKIDAAAAPITEVVTTPPNPDLKFVYDLTSTQLSFSQVQIIGEEIFITTDSTDVNASTYGTTSVDSGKAHRLDLSGVANATPVLIVGGAASLGHSGSVIYAATGDKAQTLSTLTATDPEAGQGINGQAASKVTRRLWLRTL